MKKKSYGVIQLISNLKIKSFNEFLLGQFLQDDNIKYAMMR